MSAAGLPEDDEAVRLARLAKARGTTLESIAEFARSAARGQNGQATSGQPDPAAEPANLYQDMGSYCR